MLCCRGPAAVRPLFLAAPGVANAQSAYFSFSRYLAWSTQPIYVLEKDNALNIEQLARRNAGEIRCHIYPLFRNTKIKTSVLRQCQ